jgi:hypothetical protein
MHLKKAKPALEVCLPHPPVCLLLAHGAGLYGKQGPFRPQGIDASCEGDRVGPRYLALGLLVGLGVRIPEQRPICTMPEAVTVCCYSIDVVEPGLVAHLLCLSGSGNARGKTVSCPAPSCHLPQTAHRSLEWVVGLLCLLSAAAVLKTVLSTVHCATDLVLGECATPLAKLCGTAEPLRNPVLP